MYLGDNLFEHGVARYARLFEAQRPDALIALVEVPDPSAFGVARLEGNRVAELIEKPKVPISNLAVAGAYFFTPRIFEALDGLPPSARGEYEITDAIQRLIREGATVLGERVQGWWKDTGKPQDLLDANHLLLERLETRVEGQVSASRLSGRVPPSRVFQGHQLQNCRPGADRRGRGPGRRVYRAVYQHRARQRHPIRRGRTQRH